MNDLSEYYPIGYLGTAEDEAPFFVFVFYFVFVSAEILTSGNIVREHSWNIQRRTYCSARWNIKAAIIIILKAAAAAAAAAQARERPRQRRPASTHYTVDSATKTGPSRIGPCQKSRHGE
jgi:hypothetical protein